MNADFMLQKN